MCAFGLIVKQDALVASHDHYHAVAVGGRLSDATPSESSVIAGTSWVLDLAPNHQFHFREGVKLAQGIPFDWSHFEYMATMIQPSVSHEYGTSEVHVVCSGGTYSFDLFCPNCHDNPAGRNFLIVFNTAETIRLVGSADGRKWQGSVLAPFAEVIVSSTSGYVDGQVIAKSYREEGAGGGSLQLHGFCFLGQHGLSNGHANSFLCTGAFCASRSVGGVTTSISVANCNDRLSGKKCSRKARKGKCRKQRVSKRCPASCGQCSTSAIASG